MAASEELEIIDLDEQEELLDSSRDDESWLVTPSEPSAGATTAPSWKKWNISDDPEARMKKRSLVEKLDAIAKGSPSRFSSPIATNYFSRPSMSSTPMATKQQTSTRFDPRTFTKPSPTRTVNLDSTFELKNNLTFTRKVSRDSSNDALEDDRLSTASDSSASHRLNDVGDVQNLARLQEESLKQARPQLNATFDKSSPLLNTTYQKSPPSLGGKQTHNSTFEVTNNDKTQNNRRSSHHDNNFDNEDRLSSTSDSSMSHRLNDVGDVQNLARLQEENLRQAVMSNNHRSATVSPSSENSPSNDLQSEEGSYGNPDHPNHLNFQQYSSQDSLPDSPYSSQSLDSQSAQGPDPLRRSMPNLNKIRGQNKAPGGAGSSQLPGGGGNNVRPHLSYGLSRQHNSDPRLQNQHQPQRYQQSQPQQKPQQNYGAPSRGAVVSRDSSAGSSSGGVRYPTASTNQGMRFQKSGLRPPSSVAAPGAAGSRIARPQTGIPRPGSRLPAPRSSGIPKPGSNPGSRASSVGARKTSAPEWMANCY